MTRKPATPRRRRVGSNGVWKAIFCYLEAAGPTSGYWRRPVGIVGKDVPGFGLLHRTNRRPRYWLTRFRNGGRHSLVIGYPVSMGRAITRPRARRDQATPGLMATVGKAVEEQRLVEVTSDHCPGPAARRSESSTTARFSEATGSLRRKRHHVSGVMCEGTSTVSKRHRQTWLIGRQERVSVGEQVGPLSCEPGFS